MSDNELTITRYIDAPPERVWDAMTRRQEEWWCPKLLRIFARTDLTAEFPTLVDYVARGDARPAFQRALAAQIADFDQQPAA